MSHVLRPTRSTGSCPQQDTCLLQKFQHRCRVTFHPKSISATALYRSRRSPALSIGRRRRRQVTLECTREQIQAVCQGCLIFCTQNFALQPMDSTVLLQQYLRIQILLCKNDVERAPTFLPIIARTSPHAPPTSALMSNVFHKR